LALIILKLIEFIYFFYGMVVATNGVKREGDRPMMRFKMTCPDCSAVIITRSPLAAVWELCPSCRRHVWDSYDALMAEAFASEKASISGHGIHPDN
jgi:hypothetical protein